VHDPLMTAAKCLGVPVHTSAGPGQGPSGAQIWARWPRSRLDIAHDALALVTRQDRDAGVAPAGSTNVWRAYAKDWSYEGDFVDAVASLALHVTSSEETGQWSRPAIQSRTQ
jgi:hypothetical protein